LEKKIEERINSNDLKESWQDDDERYTKAMNDLQYLMKEAEKMEVLDEDYIEEKLQEKGAVWNSMDSEAQA